MQRSYNTGNSSESWKRGPLVTNSGTVFRSDGSQALWRSSSSSGERVTPYNRDEIKNKTPSLTYFEFTKP